MGSPARSEPPSLRGDEATRARISGRRRHLAAEIAPAVLVALPAFFWVWTATVRASWTSLGRDQGIFQYIAWAVGQGDVAYRDVRDVNGPVVTMVHAFFQSLGGANEHRFRVLDLAINGLAFAFAGACLPSIACGARLDATRAEPIAWSSRAAWALAAWVALSAQYLVYGFWDTAQRESFLDWFVLASISLQATRAASGDVRSRKTAAVLFLSGAASFVPWLGKPTFVLFTISQIFAILVGSQAGDVRATRARRLVVFLAGGVVGMLGPLCFLFARGDWRAWMKITFVDVPAMYRFIWPSPPLEIMRLAGYATLSALAVATTLALVALVALGRLSRRALPVAAMPVLGLGSMLIQAKGFPYHFHPVTLGFTFGWLVALATLWRTRRPRALASAVPLILAVVLGGHALRLAQNTPDPPEPIPSARDRASLEGAARLAAFERIDFFPRALRDAAEYVAARTGPDDRVQTYGMDAYLLFLAGRRSATPYVYSYDLNVDAALVGSFSPNGPHPTAIEADRIRAMQVEHAVDLLARIERAPPAAFVFFNRSPLMTQVDAYADFASHCADAATWVATHYRETAEFDGIRVWLRNDLTPQ